MIPIKASMHLAPFFRRGCRSVAEAGVESCDDLKTTPGPTAHPLPRKGAWGVSSGFDDTDKSDFHARLVTESPIMG